MNFSSLHLLNILFREVGTIATSVIYATLVFSCALTPTLLISKFKEKRTLALSMLGYSVFIVGHFHPELYCLVPTAMVLGLGAAPMWAAKSSYLSQVSLEM